MDKDHNKWTRERGFWERNGPEIGILIICGFFLALMVLGSGFVLLKPEIPGLSTLFKDPPPPKPDPYAQKLTLQPGEQEILLFHPKPKPPAKPEPAPAKPRNP
jgi:hypothetical protein